MVDVTATPDAIDNTAATEAVTAGISYKAICTAPDCSADADLYPFCEITWEPTVTPSTPDCIADDELPTPVLSDRHIPRVPTCGTGAPPVTVVITTSNPTVVLDAPGCTAEPQYLFKHVTWDPVVSVTAPGCTADIKQIIIDRTVSLTTAPGCAATAPKTVIKPESPKEVSTYIGALKRRHKKWVKQGKPVGRWR